MKLGILKSMTVVLGMVIWLTGNGWAQLSFQAVQDETGIEWKTVERKQSDKHELIRRLSRPYPPGKAGTNRSGATVTGVVDSKGATAIAEDFLVRHAGLFVGQDHPELVANGSRVLKEVIANKYPPEYADRGTDFTVVFHQQYGGTPVFEAHYRVSMTQFGEIWSVDNGFSVVENVPTKPELSAEEATERCRTVLGDRQASPASDPQLMIFPPSRLVWRLNFLRPNFKEMLIDAMTAEVVLMRKNVRDELPSQH